MVQNPLRLLKRGFATYTHEDQVVLAKSGRDIKEDIERDRRLEDGEEERITALLAELPVERVLFLTALESAMRLRECYTLCEDQVAIAKRTIYLSRTKNGHKRQVPMSSTLVAHLSGYMESNSVEIAGREGRLFPFWDGDLSERSLDAATSDLSRIYRGIFARAGAVDFHFHDLRHEATCRLYERTSLSDVQIARITGHTDLRQLKRYASLRGSDLAQHLW